MLPRHRPNTAHWTARNAARLVQRQDEQEHHDVRRQPDDDHCGLDPLLGPDPSLQQRPDAGGVEVEPLEGQQGKEEPALVADEPARQAAAPLDLAGGEGEGTRGDVRVEALLVGGDVVTVVLGLPPAVAQPREPDGHDPGRRVVPDRRAEDLPMCRVVTEEPELGHQQAQRRREQQLEPRVAEDQEAGSDGEPRPDAERDQGPVVAVATLKQVAGADGRRQLGVEVRGTCRPGPGRRGFSRRPAVSVPVALASCTSPISAPLETSDSTSPRSWVDS